MPGVQFRQRRNLCSARKQRLQPEGALLQLPKLIRVQTSQCAGRFFKHSAQLNP